MDVPSPINCCRFEDAQAWADAANVKRPWRVEFFAAIVAELGRLPRRPFSVLELGSGPGYLAQAVFREFPDARYTLLDSSSAMHDLARARLGAVAGAQFVTTDFTRDSWADELGSFDAVVTVQAVHELRHKRHALGLHEVVRRVLGWEGLYLVCDHVMGRGGMANAELYMTIFEQAETLTLAGFNDVSMLLEKGGLVLHRGRRASANSVDRRRRAC